MDFLTATDGSGVVLGVGLAAGGLFMMAVWALSVRMRDASIIDRFWGLGFVLLALVYGVQAAGPNWHQLLVLALITLWGLRLSWHIHSRNHGEPEDARYRAMRERNPRHFWWTSLFTVFLLQALIAWVIAMPLYAVMVSEDGARALTLTDVAGVVLFAVGFYFEAVGDWQLSRFKRDPANKGKVLDSGLWGLTRHPNYFGDACVWWGLFLLALGSGGSWTVFSPLLMTVFLRYVSGVSMLEKSMKARRPKYAEYVATVPPFVPRLWPRSGGRRDDTRRDAEQNG